MHANCSGLASPGLVVTYLLVSFDYDRNGFEGQRLWIDKRCFEVLSCFIPVPDVFLADDSE